MNLPYRPTNTKEKTRQAAEIMERSGQQRRFMGELDILGCWNFRHDRPGLGAMQHLSGRKA
jgi:hypothetical protein